GVRRRLGCPVASDGRVLRARRSTGVAHGRQARLRLRLSALDPRAGHREPPLDQPVPRREPAVRGRGHDRSDHPLRCTDDARARPPGRHALIESKEYHVTSVSRRLAEEAERIIPGGVNSATRNTGAPWAWKSARGATI